MSERTPPAAAVPADGAAARPSRWFLQAPLPLRALLALLSGLSVWPLMHLAEAPWNFLVTGAAFGALVLVPFLEGPWHRIARALALAAGAALIHWGAVSLAIHLELDWHAGQLVVYALPGLSGALLSALLTVGVAPVRAAGRTVLLATLAGLTGGVVFGISPGSDAWVWGDYLLWQLLVFGGLYAGAAPGRPAAA